MVPPLPPPVIRVLYRSLLRASRYGRHPEVFGPHGAEAAAAAIAASRASYSDTFTVRRASNPSGDGSGDGDDNAGVARNAVDTLVIPSTPEEVRSLLRSTFHPPSVGNGDGRETSDGSHSSRVVREGAGGGAKGTMDAFAALREANEASSILCPRRSSLPSTLPIFDYPAAALLPGEETSFNFFEPRYLLLVDIATAEDENGDDKRGGGGGYFLLRDGPGPNRGSVLVKIVERAPLPNGNVAVRCVGGPRVLVVREDEVVIDSSSAGKQYSAVSTVGGDDEDGGDGRHPPPPLARATRFLPLLDRKEGSDLTDLQSTRSRILDLIASMTNLRDVIGTFGGGGLPPVDPECFSFWALRFVLDRRDVPRRFRWLYGCLDSGERMGWVEEFIRQHHEVIERERQKGDGRRSA